MSLSTWVDGQVDLPWQTESLLGECTCAAKITFPLNLEAAPLICNLILGGIHLYYPIHGKMSDWTEGRIQWVYWYVVYNVVVRFTYKYIILGGYRSWKTHLAGPSQRWRARSATREWALLLQMNIWKGRGGQKSDCSDYLWKYQKEEWKSVWQNVEICFALLQQVWRKFQIETNFESQRCEKRR